MAGPGRARGGGGGGHVCVPPTRSKARSACRDGGGGHVRVPPRCVKRTPHTVAGWGGHSECARARPSPLCVPTACGSAVRDSRAEPTRVRPTRRGARCIPPPSTISGERPARAKRPSHEVAGLGASVEPALPPRTEEPPTGREQSSLHCWLHTVAGWVDKHARLHVAGLTRACTACEARNVPRASCAGWGGQVCVPSAVRECTPRPQRATTRSRHTSGILVLKVQGGWVGGTCAQRERCAAALLRMPLRGGVPGCTGRLRSSKRLHHPPLRGRAKACRWSVRSGTRSALPPAVAGGQSACLSPA